MESVLPDGPAIIAEQDQNPGFIGLECEESPQHHDGNNSQCNAAEQLRRSIRACSRGEGRHADGEHSEDDGQHQPAAEDRYLEFLARGAKGCVHGRAVPLWRAGEQPAGE